MKSLLTLVCLLAFCSISTYAFRCYQCQDLPPLNMKCQDMVDQVLEECPERFKACTTYTASVYEIYIHTIRLCGNMGNCLAMMNNTLPFENNLSCEECPEEGCNGINYNLLD